MAANMAACLVPVVVLALFYLVLFPNDLSQLQSALSPCDSVTPTASKLTEASLLKPAEADDVDFRMFFGILTRPDFYERRALLRMAYALQPPPRRAAIDVRFVMCSLDKEEDAVLVALEIITHGDILVLNCTENMNDGKTYDYFSALPRLFAAGAGDGDGAEPHPHYDYAGKIDDDTYYRLGALADTLRDKPRRDMYHRFLNPCHIDREWQYMSGMGYIVSWDVAEWIAASPELRDQEQGYEDDVFGRWLRKGGKGKNKYGEEPRMYDYLDREMYANVNCFRHELIADTVAVHKLKDRLKWARTLRFFNATDGLKPSKMYHVDLTPRI